METVGALSCSGRGVTAVRTGMSGKGSGESSAGFARFLAFFDARPPLPTKAAAGSDLSTSFASASDRALTRTLEGVRSTARGFARLVVLPPRVP